jgi:hypothetical protein
MADGNKSFSNEIVTPQEEIKIMSEKTYMYIFYVSC